MKCHFDDFSSNCDTDQSAVTLKQELTHQLGTPIKKHLAFKINPDQSGLYFATSFKYSLGSLVNALLADRMS